MAKFKICQSGEASSNLVQRIDAYHVTSKFSVTKIALNLLFEIIDWSFRRKVELYKVRRGGQVVYVIAFYSEDLSSNAAQAYIIFCKICVLKEAVVGGPLKKVGMYKHNNDEKEFVEP